MTTWEDSRNQSRRHIHTPIEEDGQLICTGCRQVVIRPITDSNDPRLQNAGFMRSPHHEEEAREFEGPYSQPLPEILHVLHTSGDEFGYKLAPPAPYIYLIYNMEFEKNEHFEPEDLWDLLASKV